MIFTRCRSSRHLIGIFRPSSVVHLKFESYLRILALLYCEAHLFRFLLGQNGSAALAFFSSTLVVYGSKGNKCALGLVYFIDNRSVWILVIGFKTQLFHY